MLHGKGANENLPKELKRTRRVSGSKSSSGIRVACSADYGFVVATKRGYGSGPQLPEMNGAGKKEFIITRRVQTVDLSPPPSLPRWILAFALPKTLTRRSA